MGASPFDLVETDLHIERIDILLMLIAHKLLIDQVGVVKFPAVFHLQHAG